MSKVVNLRIVFKVVAINFIIVSMALLLSLLVALIYAEPILPFLASAGITAFSGILLLWFTRPDTSSVDIHLKDTYLIVSLAWFMLGLSGSLPYLISNSIPSFVNAFFESVSGFTTTGSSILSDIESLPKSILFWRSLTHWIGGIGIIVLVIIILPSLNIGSYQLFTLESSLQEKIRPKIRQVGSRIFFIYLMLTAGETLLLRLGGMNLYESVCHSFGTIATGGFSPRNDSIASYSPYIQYVIMIFMLLSGMNFALHYYLLKGRLSKVKSNEELHFYFGTTFAIGAIITLVLWWRQGMAFEQAFRDAYFQVISIITCTGFATDDYLQWPVFAWLILFAAMFLGGSTGSTAGGIKMVRHLVFFKNIRQILRKAAHPHAIFNVKLNHHKLSHKSNFSILLYMFVYLMVFFVGTLVLVALGIDMQSSAGSVATCMAGIGPGLGSTGPASNFAALPDAAKLVLTFLMVLGRLEIYPVLIILSPGFWKKY